ncbi:hypothetical protein U91I_00145 [alpha proteobacterium U9-1i]|nr:hypothetical protein U91I_00145 [alpha proteobacterium U9-1i]
MAETTLTILGQPIRIAGTPEQAQRLADLARNLEARLPAFSGDPEGLRRLILTALALMDETQVARASLALAHEEIERLTDMIVETQPDPQPERIRVPPDGRLTALSRAVGAA